MSRRKVGWLIALSAAVVYVAIVCAARDPQVGCVSQTELERAIAGGVCEECYPTSPNGCTVTESCVKSGDTYKSTKSKHWLELYCGVNKGWYVGACDCNQDGLPKTECGYTETCDDPICTKNCQNHTTTASGIITCNMFGAPCRTNPECE